MLIQMWKLQFIFGLFCSYVSCNSYDGECKWNTYQCGKSEVLFKTSQESGISSIVQLDATLLSDAQCFSINDKERGHFQNYEVSVDMLNVASKNGIQYGHLGIIFNFIDTSNYDFFYWRVHNCTCGGFQAGYALKGQLFYDEKLHFFDPIDATKFHLMKLVIDNDVSNSTKVFFDGNLMGSFQEYFSPQLMGGILVYNNYGNIGLFKNFNIKPCEKFNDVGQCLDDENRVCPDNPLSDVNKGTAMEANGWVINVTHSNNGLSSQCGDKTWYGWWRGTPVGSISATLKGSGTATIVFGNCVASGYVNAYLNNKLLGSAKPNVNTLEANFAYSKGDVLTITEHEDAVIKLHEASFFCQF